MSTGVIIPTILSNFVEIEKTIISIAEQKRLPAQLIIAVQTSMSKKSDLQSLNSLINSIKQLRDITSIITTDTKGVSVNRNVGLHAIQSEIVVFLDDDTTLLPHAILELEQAFKERTQSAVITAASLDENNEPRKKYKSYSFDRTKLNIFGAGAIEIVARTEFLKSHNITFNENFGLGATYPIAEEAVFLNDVLQAGGKVTFVPLYINQHPKLSTGTQLYDKKKLIAYGAAFRKIYSYYSLILAPIFIAKKTLSGHVKSPFVANWLMLKGIFSKG